MALSSGHEARVLEGEEFLKVTEHFPTFRKMGVVRYTPGGWIFPEPFRKYSEHLYNLEVRPTDVFLVTFPKVGTTWTQEILWTMMFNPDLDNPDQSKPIDERSPFIDMDMFYPREITSAMKEAMKSAYDSFYKLCPGKDPDEGKNWQMAAAVHDPRLLKSHLPLSLLPPSLVDVAKVIYVVRDPSDVVPSYYHHCRLFTEMKFTGTLDNFCQLFLTDDMVYSPYWLHVKEAIAKKDHPNMHILRYEDMKSDVMAELRKLNEFLGLKLDETQLSNVSKHTTFEAMKNRKTLFGIDVSKPSPFVDADVLSKDGGFFRQGTTGDGKKKLSPEMHNKMKEWTEKYFNFGLNYE